MRRNRWVKRVLAGLLALGPAAGCKQQLFMEPQDYRDALMSSLPRGLENNPHDTIMPSRVDRVGKVATVLDPDLPPRLITLKECIAIALEQGNIGSSSQPGFKNDALPGFNGGQFFTNSDSIRVFAIDPAIAATQLERSLSKFDARWTTAMQWQKLDQPTPAQFLAFQNSQDAANLSTTLAKPLPTGGVAGITFSTNYSKFDSRAAAQLGQFVNPNYIPQLQFTFEQPLLRLFGVEVNQLTPTHPGSQLLNLPASGGQGTPGILISRIRVDQSKAAFDGRVNTLLLNVEAAYWNLFAAYYNLYAQEEGLRQSFEGYRFTDIRVEVGQDPPQNRDQARAQFERFRRGVLEARGEVLERERNLRGLLGLRSDDGTRLVPIDNPNLSPYVPDFNEAANEALANLPELLIARQDLKSLQLNLLLQKNLRRPDLRAFGTYNIAGLGTRLDGNEFSDPAGTVPGNALANLASNQFNSWTLGFRLDFPIGFRDANASVREAQLSLARAYYALRDEEMKALEVLVERHRRLIQAHAVIGPARAEREALQLYIARVRAVIEIGRWQPQEFLNFLTVQQQLATAIAVEFQAIANYNIALAAFEHAKGTIQRYNNVTVSEGPLPPWAQKKAADHIRARTEAALKLRERDVVPPPAGPGVLGGEPIGPPTGTGIIDRLPPFAQPRDPLPDKLPSSKPIDPKANPPEMPPADGKKGQLPLPSSADGLPLIPRAFPTQNSEPATGPGAGDYFQPSGRVALPSRAGTGSVGNPSPSVAPPPATGNISGSSSSPVRLPAPPALDTIPVPPNTKVTLPVPPALPTGSGDLAPSGAVPVIPTPSEPRYPTPGDGR